MVGQAPQRSKGAERSVRVIFAVRWIMKLPRVSSKKPSGLSKANGRAIQETNRLRRRGVRSGSRLRCCATILGLTERRPPQPQSSSLQHRTRRPSENCLRRRTAKRRGQRFGGMPVGPSIYPEDDWSGTARWASRPRARRSLDSRRTLLNSLDTVISVNWPEGTTIQVHMGPLLAILKA